MEPIAAISSASNNGTNAERFEQYRAQQDLNHLQGVQDEVPGAHIQRIVITGQAIPPTMNVVSAGNMFSNRLKNGFYMKELGELMAMVGDDNVSPGQKTAAAMDVQARVGVATVVGKIATKLAEGLQSVVTKG
jgi:hypothetical protein